MGEDDYELLRQKNIAEKNAIFADFFKDLKKQTGELKELEEKHSNTTADAFDDTENQPPRKRRKTIAGDSRTYKFHKAKTEVRKRYNTRSRSRNSIGDESNDSKIDDEDIDEPRGDKPKLKVLFPWAKPFQRSIDLMKMGVCDVDEEEENDDRDYDDTVEKRKTYKVSKSEYDPDSIPSVDEITEDMLDNVAEKSSLKVYCKVNGTSCHQCRQKTLDTKTVCRSGECIGVRGQFCGPCLRGRYGESAVEALKDSNWACPPCRGLCNCSICRTRSGLRPTGILAPVVQEEGFSSVMDYLQAAETDDT